MAAGIEKIEKNNPIFNPARKIISRWTNKKTIIKNPIVFLREIFDSAKKPIIKIIIVCWNRISKDLDSKNLLLRRAKLKYSPTTPPLKDGKALPYWKAK